VVEANEFQRQRMVQKVEELLGPVSGRTLAVLGLSFKPNTDDVRLSPAIDIIARLQARGARIRAFDPQAMDTAAAELEDVVFARDAYDAAVGADALLLLTEWNEFRGLDLPRIKAALNEPVLIDMRNVYDRAVMERLGFRYAGVGR
jgi:UDPglucose 6-dehydrogenase